MQLLLAAVAGHIVRLVLHFHRYARTAYRSPCVAGLTLPLVDANSFASHYCHGLSVIVGGKSELFKY